MVSDALDDAPSKRQFVSVGLRMAGILSVAVLLEMVAGMAVIHVPFLPWALHQPVFDLLTSFIRLFGASLAVVYGVTALR